MFPKINWLKLNIIWATTLLLPTLGEVIYSFIKGLDFSIPVGFQLIWSIPVLFGWSTHADSINRSLGKLRSYIESHRKSRAILAFMKDRDLELCTLTLHTDISAFRWKFRSHSKLMSPDRKYFVDWELGYEMASRFVEDIYKQGYFCRAGELDFQDTLRFFPISKVKVIEISKKPTQEDLNVLRKIAR